MARAPVSKTGCWGFESLLACQFKYNHQRGHAVGKVSGFLGNVKGELRKVTWPTKKDTYASTLVVIVFVFMVGIYLWGVDTILSTLIKTILSR